MGMGATTLPPTWGHVTRYPFTSSFMRRGTVNWSQMKLTFSPWWVLLIDKSWRSPSILGSGLGDCLSDHYFLVMCVFRAPDTHASPLLFLIITDVSLITWGARMLLPLGWARAETDIQWQQAGGWQRRRDCLDPDEDVTRSLRLIYSHDSSLPTCFVFQILTLHPITLINLLVFLYCDFTRGISPCVPIYVI